MALQQIPWPNLPAWEQVITLDEEVYTLSARFTECPLLPDGLGEKAFWVLDVADANGNPLEVGLKVVPGTFFAFRSAFPTLPLGLLFLSTYGPDDVPDVPSYDDMTTGKVILFYDSALST